MNFFLKFADYPNYYRVYFLPKSCNFPSNIKPYITLILKWYCLQILGRPIKVFSKNGFHSSGISFEEGIRSRFLNVIDFFILAIIFQSLHPVTCHIYLYLKVGQVWHFFQINQEAFNFKTNLAIFILVMIMDLALYIGLLRKATSRS